MANLLHKLLHARTGRMTGELTQKPGRYRLGMLPERLAPATVVRSTCGFCSTGCGLQVHLDAAGRPINLSPDPAFPVNRGMACPKGWEALAPALAPDRLTTPLLRDKATGELRPVGWAEAMEAFVTNFKGVQERHGKHALSFLSTGQIVMEEMALLGALAKFGMGMLHIDSNTRQCMATSHVAYRQSFGFDAPPFTYDDFEQSDVMVFIGANPAIAHPIMWQRVMANTRKPLIVVLDPRRTETAMAAGMHLQLRPKSDLTLLYALARELITRGLVDRAFVDAHVASYHAFAEFVAPFTLERAEREAGIPAAQLAELARLIGDKGKRVSLWWTMGVNQSHQSTRTAQAIINLCLLTGQIGRPGTGPNSITGQCNAMGSRLFGNASTLLGGHDFASESDRERVAGILKLDTALIPSGKSKAYDQILDAVDTGEIRGLWVIATNPAHSWINQGRFPELRAKLDFLVVQDLYGDTEVARMADLVLPAAGWGEKDGTFINSERRISVTRRVTAAPGQALPDFDIFRMIAAAWGCGELFREWSTPEAAFRLLRELTRGRPADFTGVEGYEHLQREGGIQWPFSEADARACGGSPERHRRLFADGRFFTADGRAVLLFDAPRPLPEPTDEAYPFWLNTGRGTSAQWHTGSRTRRSAVLRRLAPAAQLVEIHPDDAARLGITDGARVVVRSRRGSASALASVANVVTPGQLFMPMHFPEMNRLTFPAYDPHSRQPAYKACAVTIELAR